MTGKERERLQMLARRYGAQYCINWYSALLCYREADKTESEMARRRYMRNGIEFEHTAKAFHRAHDMLYNVFGKQLGDKPLLEPPERVVTQEEATTDD